MQAKIRVLFAGNRIGGDDSIGPKLYDILLEKLEVGAPEVAFIDKCSLEEIGVSALDLLTTIVGDEQIIIVDAVRLPALSEGAPSEGVLGEGVVAIGDVRLFGESEIKQSMLAVSAHDVGVEQAIGMLRQMKPGLPPMRLLGIAVSSECVQPYAEGLSPELEERLPEITERALALLKEAVA